MQGMRKIVSLSNLTLVVSLVLFGWLIYYFNTGAGGARHLATLLVPIALTIHVLFTYQERWFYPRLFDGINYLNRLLPERYSLHPRLAAWLNHLAAVVFIGICAYAFWYFWENYEQIAIWRQGAYTRHDFIVGLLMFLLVMELSRMAHPILFWVNVVLVLYTIWGYLSPVDFFWHPGTTFYRVITSSTMELSTGVYGLYAQLSLTLIAAFLLLAAVAAGFDAQNALVNVMRRLAGKSRHGVPQTAVLASVSVGMVSGSGAANTAVTGSFTIPLMKRYGVPPVYAGGVETAASMGGLIMPPLMAVAGFLMAELLGVPYWEVVQRGFAVAFVYFTSLMLSVYLISVALLPNEPVPTPTVPAYQQVKTAIFFGGIMLLVVLMGYYGMGALRAALNTAGSMFVALLLAFCWFKYVRRDPALDDETLIGNLRKTVETHAEMTSYLVLLMATLGIMIGLFTVTGFILRMGNMMVQLGDWHLIATILAAFAFGWLAGTGLPPTATYIIVAIIIVPPLRTLGVDPWVAHFFAFLLAIWGELSPPTSLTAAVASRIAKASFMRTMWVALKICIPITIMSFAIFVRTDMVVLESFQGQLRDTLLVAIGTCGVTFAVFGRFVFAAAQDAVLRLGMLALAGVVIFHPDTNLAIAAGAVALPLIVFGVYRHRKVASNKEEREAARQNALRGESAA